VAAGDALATAGSGSTLGLALLAVIAADAAAQVAELAAAEQWAGAGGSNRRQAGGKP
jgi:hypothetical protein